MNDFIQKQVDFITTTVNTLADVFEEPVNISFFHDETVFSIAAVECDSEKMIEIIKRKLFDWQLENTSSWDQRLIRITNKETLWSLTGQKQHDMTLQS